MTSLVTSVDSGRVRYGRELLASLVVFLVALPLCMGIAIASGVPPAAGLIAGIIGGIVVGSLGGSPLQVSGPAAGLAVVVYEFVQDHGLEWLGVAVMVAGLAQLVAGGLRLGQWFRAVSPAVIHGMLAGIGVLIFASQFHVMVDDKPRGAGLANLASIPEALWKGLMPLDGSAHHWAARIGLISILAIVLWKRLAVGRWKFVPGPLLAVLLCAATAWALGLPISYVSVENNLWQELRWPQWSRLPELWNDPAVLLAGLGIAVVASAETLLCAAAVDQMHKDPAARTRYDRELAAQGAGNVISGLVGGLPITGVIVRSAANVEAGAKTRWSAILHGAWLLLFIAALPGALRLIPTSALAAILVYTGYKLVNPQQVRELAKFGRGEVLVYFATLSGIVAFDLLTGVIIGVVLAAAKLLYTFSHLDIQLRPGRDPNQVHVELHGAATFVGLPKLARRLESIEPGRDVHVHLDELDYIDHACLDLIFNWAEQHEATGGSLTIDWDSLGLKCRGRRRPRRRHRAA